MTYETPVPSKLEAQWIAEQLRIACQVVAENGGFSLSSLSYVGGIDISFPKIPHPSGKDQAVAVLSILSFPALETLHILSETVLVDVPYKAGFLAMRELAAGQLLIHRARAEFPEHFPDVFLVDGSGALHPRGAGLAAHLGVITGTRCVGVAKQLLCCDGMTRDIFAEQSAGKLLGRGDFFPVQGPATGAPIRGAALISANGVKNPLFISVGNQISLDTAVAVVLACCRVRVPEPVRVADKTSRKLIKEIEAQTTLDE
jgi:deoxyinosine 3'endonuclease (endonuclease V)